MQKLKSCEQVHFTGIVPYAKMPSFLSACDILVISNSWSPEKGGRFFGSPTKLFEYMSVGRAIVASDLEQIKETLEDGKTAILFQTGDVDSMCKAINRLIANVGLRQAIGGNARQCAENFHTWKANGEKVIQLGLQINALN